MDRIIITEYRNPRRQGSLLVSIPPITGNTQFVISRLQYARDQRSITKIASGESTHILIPPILRSSLSDFTGRYQHLLLGQLAKCAIPDFALPDRGAA